MNHNKIFCNKTIFRKFTLKNLLKYNLIVWLWIKISS